MNDFDPKFLLENEEIEFIYYNSYPFLQKYINEVNMSDIGFNSLNISVPVPDSQKFYIITERNDVSTKIISYEQKYF